jgi:hypothetical protein
VCVFFFLCDFQENPLNEDEAEPTYKRRLILAAATTMGDTGGAATTTGAATTASGGASAASSLTLPKLERLDGKSIVTVSSSGSGGASRTLGDVTGGLCLGLDEKAAGILGDAPAMAALEKEVDAALKGHHDNAVVS